MHKKILAFCAALVALAALPAMASASPVLTDTEPAGTLKTVVVGSKVWAINTGNTKMTTPIGTIECTNGKMTGTVVKNSGSEIEGTITAAEFNNGEASKPCTTAFLGNVTVTVENLPYCIKAGGKLPANTWELVGADCPATTGTIKFTLHTALAGSCTYSRSTITGTFTTSAEESILKTEKAGSFGKIAGGSGCPSSGELDMTFDLYTDINGAVGPQIGIS